MTKPWATIKDEACRLYADGMTLEEIVAVYKARDFDASTRAWRKKIKEWKIQRRLGRRPKRHQPDQSQALRQGSPHSSHELVTPNSFDETHENQSAEQVHAYSQTRLQANVSSSALTGTSNGSFAWADPYEEKNDQIPQEQSQRLQQAQLELQLLQRAYVGYVPQKSVKQISQERELRSIMDHCLMSGLDSVSDVEQYLEPLHHTEAEQSRVTLMIAQQHVLEQLEETSSGEDSEVKQAKQNSLEHDNKLIKDLMRVAVHLDLFSDSSSAYRIHLTVRVGSMLQSCRTPSRSWPAIAPALLFGLHSHYDLTRPERRTHFLTDGSDYTFYGLQQLDLFHLLEQYLHVEFTAYEGRVDEYLETFRGFLIRYVAKHRQVFLHNVLHRATEQCIRAALDRGFDPFEPLPGHEINLFDFTMSAPPRDRILFWPQLFSYLTRRAGSLRVQPAETVEYMSKLLDRDVLLMDGRTLLDFVLQNFPDELLDEKRRIVRLLVTKYGHDPVNTSCLRTLIHLPVSAKWAMSEELFCRLYSGQAYEALRRYMGLSIGKWAYSWVRDYILTHYPTLHQQLEADLSDSAYAISQCVVHAITQNFVEVEDPFARATVAFDTIETVHELRKVFRLSKICV